MLIRRDIETVRVRTKQHPLTSRSVTILAVGQCYQSPNSLFFSDLSQNEPRGKDQKAKEAKWMKIQPTFLTELAEICAGKRLPVSARARSIEDKDPCLLLIQSVRRESRNEMSSLSN